MMDPATEAWMIAQEWDDTRKQAFRDEMAALQEQNTKRLATQGLAQRRVTPYEQPAFRGAGTMSQYVEPEIAQEEVGGMFSTTPDIEDVVAAPAALTPTPPPAEEEVAPVVTEEAAPRSQMYSYVNEEGNRVFTNMPPPGMSNERAESAYSEGVDDWKQRALKEQAQKEMSRVGGSYDVPGEIPETVTVVPQPQTAPPPGQPDPGRVRLAPTAGRTMGDFTVREGRGGFSPSAEVPEAGTITQAEYQALTPGQQRAYDDQLMRWMEVQKRMGEIDPLAAYNRAEEQIMKNPDIVAKLAAYKAELDKYLEAGQIEQPMYDTALAGKKRQLINESMLAQGTSAAALDARTHQRTGVMGF